MVLESDMMNLPGYGYSQEDGEGYYYYPQNSFNASSMQMARPDPYYSKPQPYSNNYKYFNSAPQAPQHYVTAPAAPGGGGSGYPTRAQHGIYESIKYCEDDSIKVKENFQDGYYAGKKQSSDDMYYYTSGKEEQCSDDIQRYYGAKQHKYEDRGFGGGADKVQSWVDHNYHNNNGSRQFAESHKLITSVGGGGWGSPNKFHNNGHMMFMDPIKNQMRRPTAGYFDDERRPIESWELKSLD